MKNIQILHPTFFPLFKSENMVTNIAETPEEEVVITND